jgi:hypothetical protein
VRPVDPAVKIVYVVISNVLVLILSAALLLSKLVPTPQPELKINY